jgi:acylphosphatase
MNSSGAPTLRWISNRSFFNLQSPICDLQCWYVADGKTVYFQGPCAGCGLSYTTRRIASGFAVTGYVRNQTDGSVEAVIQGDEKDIEACLKKIQDAFGGHIRDIEISPIVFNPNWKEFEITF